MSGVAWGDLLGILAVPLIVIAVPAAIAWVYKRAVGDMGRQSLPKKMKPEEAVRGGYRVVHGYSRVLYRCAIGAGLLAEAFPLPGLVEALAKGNPHGVENCLGGFLDMAWVAVPIFLCGIAMLRYRLVADDEGVHVKRFPFLPNRHFRYDDVDAFVFTMKRIYIFSKGRKAYSFEPWAALTRFGKDGPSFGDMLEAHGVRLVDCYKDEDYPDDLPPRSWWSTLDDRKRIILVLTLSIAFPALVLFLISLDPTMH